MSSQRRGGRIRPHQRDANDDVEILGANIAVSAEHVASVKATERQRKKQAQLQEPNKAHLRVA
jgi:hypothetical protein